MELREYQKKLSTDVSEILRLRKLCYLSAEVRTGKSLISLEACHKLKAKRVLFVTKIKAFSSIQWDYDQMDYSFKLVLINKESIHKIETNDFDVIILDEAHQYGSFPKPATYQKEIKKRFGHLPILLMSGTMSPESYSQMYHQFSISNHSPFREYSNFYKWANDYVNVKQKHLGYAKVNDYSDADIKKIRGMIRHFMISFTQEEAGFTSKVRENIIEIEMQPITYDIINRLKKDLVVKGKSGKMIIADTGAKLMQKIHQLSSGTIKFEDGTSSIIDNSKAVYIRDNFKDYKIGIFYKYVAQLESLKLVLGDKITTCVDEFNQTDKWIALQFVSGREGINLSKADYLVMCEIDFSAVTYFQAKDRMTIKDRLENQIFWLFGKNTIEFKIYKTVLEKKNYTLSNFKKDERIKHTDKNNKEVNSRRMDVHKTNKDFN